MSDFELPLSQSCSRTAQEEFNPFQKLPFELRLSIWYLSLPPARIAFTISRTRGLSGHRRYQITSTGKIPALLHTCQESRLLALQHYTIIEPGPGRGLFIDFDADFVLLIGFSPYKIVPLADLSPDVVQQFAKIKNLIVDGNRCGLTREPGKAKVLIDESAFVGTRRSMIQVPSRQVRSMKWETVMGKGIRRQLYVNRVEFSDTDNWTDLEFISEGVVDLWLGRS